MRRVWKVLVGAGVLLLFYTSFAEELSFRVDPSVLKLSIPAGKAYSGILNIYNQKNTPLTIRVYLEDFIYTEAQDGSKNFFPAGTTPFSCQEWLSFSPAEVFLPPLGTARVGYTIKVPQEAEGARFGVLFFEAPFGELSSEISSSSVPTSTVKMNIRLGVLLFIEVKNKSLRQAEISSLQVKKESSLGGLLISLDFKNTGNSYLTTKGNYYIMDKKGLIYARGEFNDVYALPGDSARLTAIWKEPLPEGIYDLVLNIDIGKAQEEAGLGGGPVIVKEAEIQVGKNGEILRLGELK